MSKKSKPTRWHKLDNTANIFPVVANKRMTNVYRISAILTEEINPQILQNALEITLPYFAAFNVRLRHGVFWHYFETNNAKPHVQLEVDPPCCYLDPIETDRFLFRILYFENRIHLEAFHALADGTGAIRFLRAICYKYLQLLHPDEFTQEQLQVPYGVEHASNIEDGYLKNYVPRKSHQNFKEPNAFHIRGEKREQRGIKVTTAMLDTQQFKAVCKENNVSVGEYVTAALLYAVYEEYTRSNGASKPISIFVPVNLRRFFASETSTNFFSNISVSILMNKSDIKFEDVLAEVKRQFLSKCTKEQFAQKLSYTARGETYLFIRIIPLPIKNSFLRIVFEHSNNGSTAAFTNMGIATVDPLFQKWFSGFRVILAPNPKEPCKVSAIAYGDKLHLTFATTLEDNALARNVVRRMTSMGIDAIIETNERE